MISELWENQRYLVVASVVFLIATGILTVLMQFDSTEILGINRWIKPIKFSISAAIFLITLAVYLFYLQGFENCKIVITWGTILIMFGEVFLVTMQSARGTTSHFNISNAFDGAVFSAMGVMIFINTLLITYLAFLYLLADFSLSGAIVWGMRLGLIIFLLGSIEGGYMSGQLGHSVGVSDGGNGLPLVNWSTEGGDLRVAHFLGLHAFQLIPLFALVVDRLKVNYSITAIFVFAIAYFAAISIVFLQALNGQPILRGF